MTNQERAIELANKRLLVRDSNNDGKISKHELESFYCNDEELKQHFTRPNLIAMANHYFDKLDKNKDGFISLEELI